MSTEVPTIALLEIRPCPISGYWMLIARDNYIFLHAASHASCAESARMLIRHFGYRLGGQTDRLTAQVINTLFCK